MGMKRPKLPSILLSRHSGMDCRNPEHREVNLVCPLWQLGSGDPCRNDEGNLNSTALCQYQGPKPMRGMTLIELSVVLLVLVALAGLTLTMLQSTPRYAECVATDTTLANIREAIMGGAGQAGYLSDMGGVPSFDNSTSNPTASSLNSLFNNPNTSNTFNPVTQRGWRGPYITGGMTCAKIFSKVNGYTLLYSIDKENVCNLLGTPSDHTTVALDSYPVIGTDSNGSVTTVLQGSPIVLMQDTTNNKYFLVSGGPTGGIETTPGTVETRGNNIDDRVLYLDTYDPAGNQPCSN